MPQPRENPASEPASSWGPPPEEPPYDPFVDEPPFDPYYDQLPPPEDDLVGAPMVGDPRVRLTPRPVKGRIVLPLTGPSGIQAWKIIVPRTQSEVETRSHDGFEWLYVLSGRLRLVLGARDLVLGAGEVAEFDTSVPHWFGSTGEGGAEVLSIFGRPGERMLTRGQDDG